MKAIKNFKKKYHCCGGKGRRLISKLGQRDEEAHSIDYARPEDGQSRRRPNIQIHDLSQRHEEPEDEHMSEHLTSVRHKLQSNPLNVRRLGPTSDNRFDRQEQCYRPK